MMISQGGLYGYRGDHIGCLAFVNVNASLLPVGPETGPIIEDDWKLPPEITS